MEYKQERLRLQSYYRWPRSICNRTLSPKTLAAAGLYFTGRDDRTKCFECGIEMYNWMDGDNPRLMHQRINPFCRFIRNQQCGNVPLGVDPLPLWEAPPDPHREMHNQILTRDLQNPIQMRMAAAPLAQVSFQTISTSTVTSAMIAKETAPFLSQEQHAPVQSGNPRTPESARTEESALLCKICLDKNLRVVFLPCGHLVTCEKCAIQLENCCYCRMIIKGKQQIFIP